MWAPTIRRLAPQPLLRLRLRLTGWYVATFAVILAALGFGLFVIIAREIGFTLDKSVRATASLAAHSIQANAARATTGGATAATIRAVARLQIPERALYLFDPSGRLLYPDTASSWVRGAAAEALGHDGRAGLVASIGHDHTLHAYAERVSTGTGADVVTVVAADAEELGDAYARLIALFGATAVAAVGLVAAGGIFLARKATAPVAASFEHMRRFMADAAHELRTPVAVLRAHADVALEQRRTADQYAATLRDIRREAASLSGIVDDLLTLARVDAGEKPIERRRLYLDDIAVDAAGAVRGLAERNGLLLEIVDFEEAPAIGDAKLIRRLLMIVLDNAIKYTPTGGRVSIGIASSPAPTVTIRDTGAGIAPDVLPHIFERFYRGAPGHAHPEGAGLGLAIARSIAGLHSAELGVSSVPGAGTCVTIRFPRDEQVAAMGESFARAGSSPA